MTIGFLIGFPLGILTMLGLIWFGEFLDNAEPGCLPWDRDD